MNAPAKFVPVAAALALCTVLPALGSASPPKGKSSTTLAKPQSAPIKKGVKVPKAQKLLNGVVEVSPVASIEFRTWVPEHSFFETPLELVGRWSQNNQLAEIVRWELHEIGDAKTIIATGSVAPLTTLNSSRNFSIDLGQFLPKYNEGSKDKVYELRVVTQDASFSGMRYSVAAKLTHKRKANQTNGTPEDPFSCSAKHDDHERVVSIAVPAMTAHKGTNTKGEGSDEIYFQVAHEGPGAHKLQLRLPGEGVTYKIAPGTTVGLYDWVNDNGDKVSAPYLYAGTLRHGESVAIVAWALEDDMDTLSDIKKGVISVLGVVAAVAGAVGGPYGATVAAVASGVATVNANYVPDIDSDDAIGGFGVVFENRCGRIKAGWLNFDANVDGTTVTSSFIDPVTHAQLDSRLTAMFMDDPNKKYGFSPTGWDYGEYTYVGENDLFAWRALGTSDSDYEFAVLAQVAMP